MYITERHYVERLGFLSVVVLVSKYWETKAATHIVEEVACLKGEKPYRMTVHWLVKPKSGIDYRIEKKKAISEEEYRNYVKGPSP